MYEVLDDTAAQVILALESSDSIRRVAQHLQTPYETVREAVNRLEEAGYFAMTMASPSSTAACRTQRASW